MSASYRWPAVVLLALASTASAQDLRYPPPPLEDRGYEISSWLTLKPYLRTGAFYTDNVFQDTNSDRRGDTTYTIIPGTDLHLAADDDTYLEVGYAPSFLVYHHRGGLDTVEHRLRYMGRVTTGPFVIASSGAATWAIFNADPQFRGRIRNFQGNGNLDITAAFDEVWGARGTAFASESRNFPSGLEPTNTQEWGTAALLTAAPDVGAGLQLMGGATFREIHYLDHAARLPDLSLAGPALGLKLELPELLRLEALGGYELPWIKKHNQLSRTVDPPASPVLNATAGLTPREGTELILSFRHRLDASAAAAWQQSTMASAAFTQELAADLRLQLVTTWSLRQPRRLSDQRLQSYQAILTWSPVERVSLGAQVGYLRFSVRDGGYEALIVGGALTLQL